MPDTQFAPSDLQSLQAIKPDPDQDSKVCKLDRLFREETVLDVDELFYHQRTYVMRVRSIWPSAVYVEVARPVTTSERWEKQWKGLSKRQRANVSA